MKSKMTIRKISNAIHSSGILVRRAAAAYLSFFELPPGDCKEIASCVSNAEQFSKKFEEIIENYPNQFASEYAVTPKRLQKASEIILNTCDNSIKTDLNTIKEELSDLIIGSQKEVSTGLQDTASCGESILIIGAGAGGLSCASQLIQKGVGVCIYEKSSGPGGCWNTAQYPGSRVDVANSLYSLSFATHFLWNNIYSTGEEMRKYFSDIAEKIGQIAEISYLTKVTHCIQDPSGFWTVRAVQGTKEIIRRFQSVVFSTGQLSEPKIPSFANEGLQFEYAAHTGIWPKNFSGASKKIAIIGNAASCVQLAPELASVANITIYYRTDNWFYEVKHYRAAVDQSLKDAVLSNTEFRHLFRLAAFSQSIHGNLSGVSCDGTGSPTESAIKFRRRLQQGMVNLGLGDRMPLYPPGEKRILVDDGTWAKTISRENVSIEKFKEIAISSNIITTEKTSNKFDHIVFCTGYVTDNFVGGAQIKNSDGIELSESWKVRPQAYAGVTVPDFRNLYLVYGPNTNGVVNGNIFWFIEQQAKAISNSIGQTLSGKACNLQLAASRHLREFLRLVDRGNKQRLWGHGATNSWYKHPSGFNVQNWPFSLTAYSLALGDFEEFRALPEVNDAYI
jgi:4-hydroxyacetophenone monooxygenase